MAGLTPIVGVWGTILLKVEDDGSLDLSAIAEQVTHYAAAGLQGVYSNGTAGEFHCQTEAQFRAVSSATAMAASAAGLPFQLGAAHPLAPGTLERVAFAATLAPRAIQVTLPDWTPIDLASAIRFLSRCADVAGETALVLYNPPHAKTVLSPDQLFQVIDSVPQIAGLKCAGGDAEWYMDMAPVLAQISVFIPGHHYASGTARGAHGSYSNMACLNPAATVKWALQCKTDTKGAMDTEARIAAFMEEAIAPTLAAGNQGYACDKAMAVAGGWTNMTPRLMWPCVGLSAVLTSQITKAAHRHLPEFVPARPN